MFVNVWVELVYELEVMFLSQGSPFGACVHFEATDDAVVFVGDESHSCEP